MNKKSTAKPRTIAAGRPSRSVPGAVIGAPTLYRPEYADLARKFCLLGATDEKLAELFEVSVATIYNWKNDNPDFLESCRFGKDIADAEVVDAFFHRAKGYSHPDVDIRVIQNQIVQTPLVKHYPPDTTAAMMWLKNRQPSKWRDKQELEHSGTVGIAGAFTNEQVKRIAEEALRSLAEAEEIEKTGVRNG